MVATNHYLFTARSVTHAQKMAKLLEQSGVHVKVRRAGANVNLRGCGYTIEVSERQFSRAAAQLIDGGQKPVKVFFVSGGTMREVEL